MLIVHAGNRIDAPDRATPRFPAAHVDAIRERLAVLLVALGADRVVTAAAAGADLLMLQAASRVGVPATIALPLEVEDFRRRSVDDQGAPWSAWFDDALADADEVVVEDLADEDEWYLLGNEVILDVAAERSAGPPLVVAVRAGEGSATDDLVERAERRGWSSIDLDPSIDPEGRGTVELVAPAPVEVVAALIDLDLGWRLLDGEVGGRPLPDAVRRRSDELRAVIDR